MKVIIRFDHWSIDWDIFEGKHVAGLLGKFMEVLKLTKSDKLWILERKTGRQSWLVYVRKCISNTYTWLPTRARVDSYKPKVFFLALMK